MCSLQRNYDVIRNWERFETGPLTVPTHPKQAIPKQSYCLFGNPFFLGGGEGIFLFKTTVTESVGICILICRPLKVIARRGHKIMLNF